MGEKPDFQLVGVEEKEGLDEFKINDKEREKFDKWLEHNDNINFSNKTKIQDKIGDLSLKLIDLRYQLDKLIDMGYSDFSGDIDMEDGEDTKTFKGIADEINKEINNALLELQKSNGDIKKKIDNIFSRVEKGTEKWNNVEKLSSFISKKEQEKTNSFSGKLASAILPDSVNKHNEDLDDALSILEGKK